jgi:short-subunit dehydrogenase
MKQPPGLAVVTGASSGIGLELARLCAGHGYNLVIAADEPEIEEAAQDLRQSGVNVDTVLADLATAEGVAMVVETIGDRDVDALLANAGHGLGHAFLDQDFDEIRHVIDTNITGTLDLVHQVVGRMRARGRCRVLMTGSIAGVIPGSFQAVYNGSMAFIDSFAQALRNELKDTDITVTCLMPGPTETQSFERAGLTDTKVGQSEKDDPADVAKAGFRAMQRGESQVIAGLKNKLQVAAAHVTPAEMLAQRHRLQTEPGSATR